LTRIDEVPSARAGTDGDTEFEAADSGSVEPELDEPSLDEVRRRRRGRIRLGLGAVLAAAVLAGVWWWTANRSTEDPAATTGPVATATVERGTISATESWEGTIERGTPLTVQTATAGTVTRLAAQGFPVQQGDVLFHVDEQPVVLLSGAVPMYRDLQPGATGADVAQLETSLAALGYGGFAVDSQYDASTAAAVRAWQQSVGATPTGTVPRGQVIFLAEGGQVDTVHAQVGEMVAPGTRILGIARADQVVNLEAEVDDRDRFTLDTDVTILLPGGDEITGTVTSAAVVLPETPGGPPAGGEAPDTEAEPVVQVQIALGEAAPDELVGAPVEVVVAIDERADVLLVPVTALLALAEGGYGLEVVADDGTTSIVPVETGLFAEGKVEVESPDITEGTVVGVAGR